MNAFTYQQANIFKSKKLLLKSKTTIFKIIGYLIRVRDMVNNQKKMEKKAALERRSLMEYIDQKK